MRIEDYGLIGDLQTAALVGLNGSVDWLCLPRFDSASCFAALLGDERHGRWKLAPAGEVNAVSRRYRPGTLILETDFETADGAARVIDFMPRRGGGAPQLVRIVEGLRGRVPMEMSLSLRPDYSASVPWLHPTPEGIGAAAGPDAFRLSTPLPLRAEDGTVVSEFPAIEGARERFVLNWHPSHEAAPPVEDADSALARTEAAWREWSDRCRYEGPYREAVVTSLIALKAMTNEVTGALIAAPTTSLPEESAACATGTTATAGCATPRWRSRRCSPTATRRRRSPFGTTCSGPPRAIPSKLQIMYGIGGERRLTEFELDELPGYEGSRPVRVGNAAADQFQLDVYGELRGRGRTSAMVIPAALGVEVSPRPSWSGNLAGAGRARGAHLARAGRGHLGGAGAAAPLHALQGHGLGRLRPRRSSWPSSFSCEAPVERWSVRAEIHAEVCEHGYDSERGTFTQYYGSEELDASALVLPLVGFLPPDDERMVGTIGAIQRELARDGLVSRYPPRTRDDGLPGDEGQFLACSFWLVGALALTGGSTRRASSTSGCCDCSERPRPALRGVRRRARAPGGQLPPGVQPPGAHQCRHGASARRARRGAPVGGAAQPSVNLASRHRRSNGSRQRCGAISPDPVRSPRAGRIRLHRRRMLQQRRGDLPQPLDAVRGREERVVAHHRVVDQPLVRLEHVVLAVDLVERELHARASRAACPARAACRRTRATRARTRRGRTSGGPARSRRRPSPPGTCSAGGSWNAIEMIRAPSAMRLPVRRKNGTPAQRQLSISAPQRDERLGLRVGGDARLVAVALVLAAHDALGSSGCIERKTLFFSSLIAPGSSAVGGSIATKPSTWKRCVTTMSR